MKEVDVENFFGSKQDREIAEANADLASDVAVDPDAEIDLPANGTPEADTGNDVEAEKSAASGANSSKPVDVAGSHPAATNSKKLNVVQPVSTKVGNHGCLIL
jgi:hypothetical protein